MTSIRHDRIVGLGRLVFDKGFAQLIESFSLVATRYPDWDLWIWGSGPEQGNLEEIVADLGLHDRVILAGTTTDPMGVLATGKIFAHAPQFDGVGNAYLEAMACRLPVVSFAAPGGVRAAVGPGTGFLVEPGDTSAFADRLAELIGEASSRDSMGSAGRKWVEQQFDRAVVHAQWDEVIHQVLGGPLRHSRARGLLARASRLQPWRRSRLGFGVDP